MEKNLREKCLPIDYFMERMFQIGLCISIENVKDMLLMMRMFDPTVGFQQFSEDHKKGEDRYKPINSRNKQTDTWIRRTLDKNQFKSKCDRVSLTQFLSLFNVCGVHNAQRLQRLAETLER